MAQEGEYQEGPGASGTQRAAADVFWRPDTTGRVGKTREGTPGPEANETERPYPASGAEEEIRLEDDRPERRRLSVRFNGWRRRGDRRRRRK